MEEVTEFESVLYGIKIRCFTGLSYTSIFYWGRWKDSNPQSDHYK